MTSETHIGPEEVDVLIELVRRGGAEQGAYLALARSGDPRAFGVLSHVLDDSVSKHLDGLTADIASLIAELRHPSSEEALLAQLRDEHLNDPKRKTFYKMGGLNDVIQALGTLGANSALPRLAQIACVSGNLTGPAISALTSILNRSIAECTPDQLRAVLSLPDDALDTEVVRQFDPASDEWPEYKEEGRQIDCRSLKSKAAAELRRRGVR